MERMLREVLERHLIIWFRSRWWCLVSFVPPDEERWCPLRGKPWETRGGGLFLGEVKISFVSAFSHHFPRDSWEQMLQVVRPTPASGPNAHFQLQRVLFLSHSSRGDAPAAVEVPKA